jgi:hypothetical protein
MIKEGENEFRIREPLLPIEEDKVEEELRKADHKMIKNTQGLFHNVFQTPTAGSVFCLLCLTFGSGIRIIEID